MLCYLPPAAAMSTDPVRRWCLSRKRKAASRLAEVSTECGIHSLLLVEGRHDHTAILLTATPQTNQPHPPTQLTATLPHTSPPPSPQIDHRRPHSSLRELFHKV